MLRRVLFGFSIVVGLSACTTSSVLVNIQRPADINVPQNIKKIIITNRSTPSKENLYGNIFEGIISGEGIHADRQGSEACLKGLNSMMSGSERFELKNAGDLELKGTGTASFPIPLEWDVVQSYCDSYDADALIVLATFDSDSRSYVGNPVTITRKKKGVKVKMLRYPAHMDISIESGWRIYDAKNKKIVDENKFTEHKEYSAWGDSPNEAQMSLPSKRRAVRESGHFAGDRYGFRISPIWIKRSRTYFIGKAEELKQAKKLVKRGDWDAAIAIWKPLTESADEKTARRAAYNMAVASEMQGGLDAALDWAKKANQLGEKKAYNYINVLNRRKMDKEKLKQQLNN